MSTPPKPHWRRSPACTVIGPGRLRRLLAHHEPLDALERLRADRGLHPMVVRAIPSADLTRLRNQARAASVDRTVEAGAEAGVRVVPTRCTRLPGAARRRPPGAGGVVRARRPRCPRRPPGRGDRHASTPPRPALPRPPISVGVWPTRASSRRVGFGPRHRRCRPPRRPAIAGARAPGRRWSATASIGPYPKQHTELWRWVGDAGLLLSEWPPGVPPDAWRFPQRNRIIAALCEALVVVESRERGGSLITARAAADRSVEVMAVPGSPRSRASAGTNQLLVDGVAPVTSVHDVLALLDLDHRRQCASPFDPRPIPDRFSAGYSTACAAGPCTLDHIVAGPGASFADVALAAARLERTGGWSRPGAGSNSPGSRLEQR